MRVAVPGRRRIRDQDKGLIDTAAEALYKQKHLQIALPQQEENTRRGPRQGNFARDLRKSASTEGHASSSPPHSSS